MATGTIKVKYAIVMNFLFLIVGWMIALNLVDIDSANKTPFNLNLNGDLNGDSPIRYVCVILSAPRNRERRDAIRNSWLKLEKPETFRHYFAIGAGGLDEDARRELEAEAEENGDLLTLADFIDKYEALTEKLVSTIRLVSERHDRLLYLIKCDDDSFVRVDVVLKELRQKDTSKKQLYWGYFKGNARIKSQGRWAERDWFLCDRYLPYALGGGYVISSGIVRFINKNYKALQLYKSEDAAMGVWTAPLSDILRWHDSRFDTEWTSRGCQNSLIIRHKQSPNDMAEMYDNLARSRGSKLCSEERSLRGVYEYNWNVLPSQCCASKN